MLLRHGHGGTFVAVPSYAQMPAASAFGLFKLVELDCQIACLVGNCHVDDARNLLVSVFLHETDCKQLLFIDSDTSCEDLSRFLGHDEPIVCAPIPKKNDNQSFAVNLNPGIVQADERGLIEVYDAGTGVMKIQRHVLETLFDKSPKYMHDEAPCAEIFNRAIVDGKRLSGDLNFCRKWKELGGKIHVDPEIRVTHIGEKAWYGAYGGYLRNKHGLSLTYGIEKIRNGTFERPDIVQLADEWDNGLWQAGHELLVTCIEVARQVKGPIIEIGSGLSSLVMAATGAEVHSLEHHPHWHEKTLEARERLGLDTLHLHYAPLRNYPEGRWHRAANVPWKDAQVVVCDGPPRWLANRAILYTVMEQHGCYPKLVLQDDVDSPSAIEELESIPGYTFEIMGKIKKFAAGRPIVESMRASG